MVRRSNEETEAVKVAVMPDRAPGDQKVKKGQRFFGGARHRELPYAVLQNMLRPLTGCVVQGSIVTQPKWGAD